MSVSAPPFLDVYFDEDNDQFILLNWVDVPMLGDRDTVGGRPVMPWGDVSYVSCTEMNKRGRDIVLAYLVEFSNRDPAQNPSSPPNPRLASDRGLDVMKGLTVELDSEKQRILLKGAFRDAYETIEFPLSGTNAEFMTVLRKAFKLLNRQKLEQQGWDKHVPLSRKWRDKNLPTLVEDLDSLGFYKYATQDDIVNIKQHSIEVNDLYHEETKRVYLADAEVIAECGMKDFIKDISVFLQFQGIPVTSFKEHVIQGRSYSVTINGMTFPIWSESELEEELWHLATIRTFAAVNTLLQKAGSKERLFFDHIGNDTTVVFLTDEMYRLIKESGVMPEKDLLKETG